MLVIKEIEVLGKYLSKQRELGNSIGFVPTMGALHEGHIALIRASISAHDTTVCSIFVNPTQFNESSDFDAYPSTISADIKVLEQEGCQVLFLPAVDEIYPKEKYQKPSFDFKGLDLAMEGAFRPGHFQGVGEVIKRFLDVLDCDCMYLGEKDFQQVLIIKSVVEQCGFPVKVIPVPTQRASSGLALSSRNLLLGKEYLDVAPEIYQSLLHVKENFNGENLDTLLADASNRINATNKLKVEYLTAANAKTLAEVKQEVPEEVVICTAVWAGKVRLIDNIVLAN